MTVHLIWICPAILLTVIVLLLESRKECGTLSVEAQVIRTRKVGRAYRFVFLSDLHDKEFGEGNRNLIEAVSQCRPDAILIGGDMMNIRVGKAGTKVIERLLTRLVSIAPVYYANGNNEQRFFWENGNFGRECEAFLTIVERYGVRYLKNRSEVLGDVCITGLDLELEHYRGFIYRDLTADYIADTVGKAREDKYNVLLVHSPMFPETYRTWGADLALAGHSHGGIIRFPTDWRRKEGQLNNDRGLVSGQYQLFHQYCAGYFEENGRAMIVSRGLGTHTLNVRINNKPQVVMVEIKPSPDISEAATTGIGALL